MSILLRSLYQHYIPVVGAPALFPLLPPLPSLWQGCPEATPHVIIASYSTVVYFFMRLKKYLSISSKQVRVMKYCQLYVQMK